MSIAIELDAVTPSFLSFLFCASALRRQAIFMVLAMLARVGPENLALRIRSLAPAECKTPHEQIARALMSPARAREVVRAVCGDVPEGLLGTLHRIGDNPLPHPNLYYRLFETFSDPQHRARANLLRQRGGTISANHIEIVHRLDSVLLHGNILSRVYSVSQAEDANAALNLVRATVSSATDEALRQSVRNLGEKTDLTAFFKRWLARLDTTPARSPIPEDDPDIALMVSGEKIATLGRRFRNCAVTRSVYVALGTELLLEWLHPPGLVAQCHRMTDGGWVLVAIHAKGNGRVEPVSAAAFRRKLEGFGIPALSYGDAHRRTSGVLALLGAWGAGGGNLGFDDEDDDLDQGENLAEVENAA